jgi:hypothetical protein
MKYWLSALLSLGAIANNNVEATSSTWTAAPTAAAFVTVQRNVRQRQQEGLAPLPYQSGSGQVYLQDTRLLGNHHILGDGLSRPTLFFDKDQNVLSTTSQQPAKQQHFSSQDVEVTLDPTSDTTLPVIVRPKSQGKRSLEDLQTFLGNHKDWMDQSLVQHGAILIQDFDLRTAQDVQDAIQSYQPKLNNQY